MKRGRPPKPDLTDDPPPRPPAEDAFDDETVTRLDKLQVPEVEDPAEGIETKLSRLPDERRKEAAKALKNHYTRIRKFIFDGEGEDW